MHLPRTSLALPCASGRWAVHALVVVTRSRRSHGARKDAACRWKRRSPHRACTGRPSMCLGCEVALPGDNLLGGSSRAWLRQLRAFSYRGRGPENGPEVRSSENLVGFCLAALAFGRESAQPALFDVAELVPEVPSGSGPLDRRFAMRRSRNSWPRADRVTGLPEGRKWV